MSRRCLIPVRDIYRARAREALMFLTDVLSEEGRIDRMRANKAVNYLAEQIIKGWING